MWVTHLLSWFLVSHFLVIPSSDCTAGLCLNLVTLFISALPCLSGFCHLQCESCTLSLTKCQINMTLGKESDYYDIKSFIFRTTNLDLCAKVSACSLRIKFTRVLAKWMKLFTFLWRQSLGMYQIGFILYFRDLNSTLILIRLNSFFYLLYSLAQIFVKYCFHSLIFMNITYKYSLRILVHSFLFSKLRNFMVVQL